MAELWWCVHACMYVCRYVRMNVCMHISMHECLRTIHKSGASPLGVPTLLADLRVGLHLEPPEAQGHVCVCGHEVANVANLKKNVNNRQTPFLNTVGSLAVFPKTVNSLFKKEKLLLFKIKN